MQNSASKKYSVLYKDHNGEYDMEYITANNVQEAADIFENENKYSQRTVVVISEGTEFNTTYRKQNGTYQQL